jgi:hypothetical protein
VGDGPSPLVGCPDGDVLVSYLYDEFEPGGQPTRDQVSRHVRECQVCATELEALGGVRSQLPAWVAPELESGFRLVQEPARVPAWRRAFEVLNAGWLRPVLPLTAAALVLGAGLAITRLDVRYGPDGLQVRTGWDRQTAPAAPSRPADASVGDMRAEIASLRQELRRAQTMMSAASNVTATSVTPASGAPVSTVPVSTSASGEAAMMRRLRQLIDESEMRQQQNLQLRISEIARDFKLVRQADMVQIEQGFSRLAGQRQQDAAEQQRLLNQLRNVSVQGRPPQ